MTKTVLITGASSGIGLACVQLFAENGYRILALGRNSDRLEKTVSDAMDRGASEALGFSVDMEKADSVGNFFRCEATKISRIDCLVNCAGIAEQGATRDVSDENWELTFRVNVTASFAMIRESLPYLAKSTDAAIVNVSSIAGRSRSISLSPAYTASKAAIIGMTRHLAAELGTQGIRVNAVCPSQTHTPMLEDALSPEGREELASRVPLNRLAMPMEQAQVIFFLCSSDSSYMNGAIVDVNGGLL